MENQRRNVFFDNAKFLLMTLVVFGHLLQPFTNDSDWYHDLYLFIYTFHMPAFILISGYFASSFTLKESSIRKSFCKLIIPYIMFQWIYSLFYYIIGTFDSFSLSILVPNWSLWFLVSLFCWQLSLYFFEKVKPMLGVGLSILLSLVSGYFPFIGRELTLQRTFAFLPFFIIGYYLKEGKVKLFTESQWKKYFSIGLVVVFLIIYSTYDIDRYLFFGSRPYEDFLEVVEVGAFDRLFSLILGIIGTISFLSIVPINRKFYTKWGKNTLVVYLFHGFFVKGLHGINIPQFPLSKLGLFALFGGSFILTMFLASQPVVKFYNKLTDWCLKIKRN